jgi:hypothetical protein
MNMQERPTWITVIHAFCIGALSIVVMVALFQGAHGLLLFALASILWCFMFAWKNLKEANKDLQ